MNTTKIYSVCMTNHDQLSEYEIDILISEKCKSNNCYLFKLPTQLHSVFDRKIQTYIFNIIGSSESLKKFKNDVSYIHIQIFDNYPLIC